MDDLEDTFVPGRPPILVESAPDPREDEPSGIELTPHTDALSVPQESDERWAQPWFRFRIGRTVVWLDAVCYVGRRPSSPRIAEGRMPRLVRVPSPSQEVSGTHIELRQLGSSVVVTDLRSTNGSTVFPPGATARKLRQGESVVVTPGTLIDIGDRNVIEILPLDTRSTGNTETHYEEGRS